jgi:hypothetical protein
MNPAELLHAGATLLAPVLEPAGFRFTDGDQGSGSGGPFAVGAFRKGARELELHVRGGLGIVVYRAPNVVVAHEVLMRAAANGARPAYPGFSDDPLDGFRHLMQDLERFGAVFLHGSDKALAEQAALGEARSAARRGFGALS